MISENRGVPYKNNGQILLFELQEFKSMHFHYSYMIIIVVYPVLPICLRTNITERSLSADMINHYTAIVTK